LPVKQNKTKSNHGQKCWVLATRTDTFVFFFCLLV
jgi:hypothetical protein